MLKETPNVESRIAPNQDLERDLARVFNTYSVGNSLDIPDFMLAKYVLTHLESVRKLGVQVGVWRS